MRKEYYAHNCKHCTWNWASVEHLEKCPKCGRWWGLANARTALKCPDLNDWEALINVWLDEPDEAQPIFELLLGDVTYDWFEDFIPKRLTEDGEDSPYETQINNYSRELISILTLLKRVVMDRTVKGLKES